MHYFIYVLNLCFLLDASSSSQADFHSSKTKLFSRVKLSRSFKDFLWVKWNVKGSFATKAIENFLRFLRGEKWKIYYVNCIFIEGSLVF